VGRMGLEPTTADQRIPAPGGIRPPGRAKRR